MDNIRPVPPLIQDWIDKLFSNEKEVVKNNYRLSLQNIVDEINVALEKFDKDKYISRKKVA